MTRGFTLLEVSVVMALLALIGLFLGQTYLDFSQFFGRENLQVDLNLANQNTLQDVSASVKESAAVLASAVLDSITYTSATTTLVLNLPTINTQGQIVSGSYDTLAYYLDPANQKKLVKRVQAAAGSRRQTQTKTLDSFVSFLEFQYNATSTADAAAIIMTLTSSQTQAGRLQAVTSTLRAVLRNK